MVCLAATCPADDPAAAITVPRPRRLSAVGDVRAGSPSTAPSWTWYGTRAGDERRRPGPSARPSTRSNALRSQNQSGSHSHGVNLIDSPQVRHALGHWPPAREAQPPRGAPRGGAAGGGRMQASARVRPRDGPLRRRRRAQHAGLVGVLRPSCQGLFIRWRCSARHVRLQPRRRDSRVRQSAVADRSSPGGLGLEGLRGFGLRRVFEPCWNSIGSHRRCGYDADYSGLQASFL